MKLQKLIIENIASIENATIDFETDPLKDESIFLICGPTGSGKTTILDAICLALYNTTPRLNSSTSERYEDETFFSTKENIQAIGIKDPRTLMRRNCVQASVKLYFTDDNNDALVAEWSVYRAKKKTNGNIQNVVWSLYNANDDQLITNKNSETQKEIFERIGLTFEQFCRTTLLAQGDFTKFLKSREEEKSEILEKLTGTDIYSKVGKRLFEIKRDEDNKLKEMNRDIEGIQLLQEEEIIQYKESIRQAKDNLKSKGIEKEKVENQKRWFENEIALNDQRNRCLKEWQTIAEVAASETITHEKELLSEWDQTEEARLYYAANQKQHKLIDEKRVELSSLQGEYINLLNGLTFQINSHEKNKKSYQTTQSFLSENEKHAIMYDDINLITNIFKQIHEFQEDIIHHEKEIDTLSQQSKNYEQKLKEKRDLFQQNSQEKEKQERTIEEEKSKLDEFQIDAVKQERETLMQNIEKLKSLITVAQQYHEKMESLNSITAVINQSEKDVNALKQMHLSLESEKITAKNMADEAEAIFEKQKESCSDYVKKLRSQAKVGDKCPVCGKVILEEIESDQHFEALFKPIMDERNRCRELYDKAILELTKNEEAQAQKLEHIKYETTNQTTVNKSVTNIKDKLTLSASSTEFSNNPLLYDFILIELIEKTIASENEKKLLLNDKCAKADDLQAKINHLYNALKSTTDLVEQCRKQTEIAQNELLKIQTKLQSLNNDKETKKKIIEQKILEVDQLISIAEWQEEWKNNSQQFIQNLILKSNEFKQNKEKSVALYQKIELDEREIQQILNCQKSILTIIPHWENLTLTHEIQIENLSDKWNKLYSNIQSIKNFVTAARQSIETNNQYLESFYNEKKITKERLEEIFSCGNRIKSLRENVQTISDQLNAKRVAKENSEKAYQELCLQKPEIPDGVDLAQLKEEILKLSNEIDAENQNLGIFTEKLDNNGKNRATYQRKIEAKEIQRKEFEKWSNLANIFGDGEGKNFRNIAQSYILRHLLNGANQYLHRLSERYTMTCQPGSLTILLRDEYQGGISRPTSTISGGECFLVSLSLALGLSALNKASLSIDTLFIDEGFGTLDSDYLDTVMEALENLHQIGGKKVGIISHVEALHERIGTKIKVVPENRITSKIVIESTC